MGDGPICTDILLSKTKYFWWKFWTKISGLISLLVNKVLRFEGWIQIQK